jgi:hypothetical protein
MQRPQKEEKYIRHQGVDYDGSDPLITEVFDEPIQLQTQNGVEKVKRSLVYIISKQVDGRTFLKIGAGKSTLSSTGGRLGDIQTVLLPGLENSGFRLLYIFIYPYQTPVGNSYSESIEKTLHKYLRYESTYKSTVLRFPSGYHSEWYLPEPNQYKNFLEFVFDFISVQIPFPEASHHFYTQPGGGALGMVRRRKSNFMEVSTREAILKFRQNFLKYKSNTTEMHKAEREKKAGNITYFKRRLLKPNTSPLGGEYTILDVIYQRGATTNNKIHGEYYVLFRRNTKRRSKLTVYFNDEHGDWTHISEVLAHMHKLGTLEQFELSTNYHHYARGPIERAKQMLQKYHADDNVGFKKSELGWLIGRDVIDKNNEKFKASKLVMSGQRVSAVQYKRERDGAIKTAKPRVAMKLTIDYFHGEISKDHAITDDFKEAVVATTYVKDDFIEFNPNYFIDESTKKNIPERSVALVLKDAYYDFDKATKQPELFYDLLFEHEIWFLRASDVDANSTILTSNQKHLITITAFLSNVSQHRNRIIHLLDKYKLPVRATRRKSVAPKRRTQRRNSTK